MRWWPYWTTCVLPRWRHDGQHASPHGVCAATSQGFIDTSYYGNSFFVRHAYFCGGNEPYESLKRALRADIDEEAWSSLYRTTSRPFPTPETGRIAVKVINHYGDEVMKVLEVGSSQQHLR